MRTLLHNLLRSGQGLLHAIRLLVLLDKLLILLHVVDALWHAVGLQTLLIHQPIAVFHSLLPRGPCQHALMPRLDVGEAVELLVRCAEGRGVDALIPRDEGQVSKGALVANQPFFALQQGVQDAEYALDFGVVALDGRGNTLGVQNVEPTRLSKVRTLARDLEEEVLVAERAILEIRERNLVLGVVLLDEVENNGAGFPNGQPRVWVLDG